MRNIWQQRQNPARQHEAEPVATGGRAGVSKAMLGRIERNESSPTVATLWKIATGLNVPFSAFIVPDASAAPSAFDPQQQAMVVTPSIPVGSSFAAGHFDNPCPRRAERINAA